MGSDTLKGAWGFTAYAQFWLPIAFLLGMTVVMLVVLGVVYWMLRNTSFGRNVYAVGGDYEVAKYSGSTSRPPRFEKLRLITRKVSATRRSSSSS